MSTAAAAAIFLNLLVICTAMQFTPSASDEILRNIVQSDQHLIVGSSNALYRINPESLEAVGQLSLTDANRLLVADTGGSLNGNILSCDSNRCLLVETTNFANVSWQVEPPIIRRSGRKDAVGVFVLSSDGISEIMFGEIPNGQSPRRFIKGGLVNVDFLSSDPQNSVFLKSSEFGGDSNTESFNYFAQFTQNGFVYFVTSPVAGEVFPSVARFCQNDTGSSRDDSFNSHFEIKLECRGQPTDQDTGVITAATLVTTAPFTEPTILVSILRSTSTDEARVDICAFSVTEIDQIMERKFRDCINGVGLTGFSRVFGDVSLRQCPNTIPAEVQETLRICDLPGNLRQGLEIVNPLSTNPLISQPFNSTEHLTSFTTNVVEGFLFLFAGSSDSSLYQYHFPSVSNLTFIRNVPLAEVSGTNVTDVLPAGDGEHIFAMTMNKLLAHPVDQCRLNTDCVSCLTSNDPICGWCALSGECVRGSECGSQMDRNGIPRRVYVESEAACPSLVSSNPLRIHVEELRNEVPIILSTANIINSAAVNFHYQCVFSFAMAGSVDFLLEAVNQGGGNFRCVSPRLNNIPPFLPMIDTVNATISLRPIETMINIATLGAPLEYTDCSIHTNCGDCITGGVEKCQWCPLNFTCISPLSNCPRSETTSNNACPAILPNPNTTNYLFHLGHQYPTSPLQILSRELDIFQNLEGAFSCRICMSESCSELITTSTASFDPTSNTVTCDINAISFDMVSLSLLTPFMDLTLQVRYNGFPIDNPSNVKVTAYECRYKGSNCAQCMSLLPSFDCSYCGQEFNQPGNCTFNAGSISRCPGMLQFTGIGQCDPPRIVDFEPKDGPTRGGTLVRITGNNLGTQRSDIQSISIGGVDCEIKSYEAGVGVTCETGSVQSVLVNDEIVINLDFRANSIMSQEVFRYLAPSLDNPPATPRQGPASGGTTITISGTHLGIGSQRQVLIRQQVCRLINFTDDTITCETPAGEADLNSLLEVQIDKLSLQSGGYNYVPDPTFQSITPQQSFMSGGTVFTVTGTNLDIIQEPRLLIFVTRNMVKRQAESMQEIKLQSEPCITSGSREMRCMAPTLAGIEGIQLPAMSRIGLLMDDVSALLNLNTSITVQPNPTINQFESVLGFGRGNPIELTITGSNFLFSSDDVSITITPCSSSSCPCSVLQVYSQNNSLRCEVTDPEDLPANMELTVNVTIGFFSDEAGSIRINITPPLLIILIPSFAGFLILCIVIFIVLFAVFCRKAKQKDQRYDQLMMEMERLESSVARECKLGFAELQTDLDELTGDVAGCRLPYHDLQTFFLSTLFPDHKDHPVLHRVQIAAHQQPPVQRALRDFEDLLNDRKVLLIFIQSLEEQRSFVIRDKSTVGSLLIVALHDKLDYATDVLKKLLTQLIRKTVSNSIPKLLLRRTESIAEKMLTNWLAFCLQGYLMEHAGQPMFMLYRAVKNQLEKGPIDVITGEARYSLSEQKLIRQKVDVVSISATVETEDGLRVPVKLLDCDTISQAKEKLLDSMHKAAPVSTRPKLTEVDLEYLKSPSETMVLRDEDHSTVVEGGWKKLNTLRHYWVQDGAMFRIKSRRDYPPPGRVFDYPGSIIATHSHRQRALSEAEDGTRVWHLFKQNEMEDPKRSPFLNKKMVSEIYLPRMLSTKSILQNFVDELFNALFTIAHPPSSPTASAFPMSPGAHVPMGYAPGADAVPMAVKYLFDFLDDAAEDCKITDSDVVHTWKNNALALRFWVNMIKNPEFVFDINKSHTVDACLSVVAQAFIDGCSSADTRLNIDSPTSKLLYNKEVQVYKTKVKKFYSEVKQMPRIPEDAMQYYLRQLSEYQTQQMKKTGGFVTESAFNELLRYAIRYSEPFLANLRTAGLQQRAYQFEGVLKISRSSTLL